MKVKAAGLQTLVGNVISDLNKTYYAGRIRQRTVDGKLVTAPPLTTFADVLTLTGVQPGHCIFNVNTGRKFELQLGTNNTPTVLAFTYDTVHGTWVLIGKVILTIPAGTHSYRGFNFDDSDPNNIKLMVTSTVTTALCLGGTYYTWGLTLADFTLAGTTIYMATGPNQKAVYFAQNPAELGRAHVGTTSGGVASGANLGVLANKTKFFQQNGAAATLQIYGWDTSLGNPTVEGMATNIVNSSTGGFGGTSPTAYFSMGASQLGYSTVANSAGAFEAVILQNGSANIPSNFTASPANTAQTMYYLRDLQQVGGVWYFNLSTTSTGSAVVPAQANTGFSMMRAVGISGTHFLFKHGNVTPALTGTVLQAHSFGVCIPTNAPTAPSLNGQDCLFIATSSNLYLLAIADLSNGGTAVASLSGVNLLGNGTDITAPTAILARYNTTLDRWVYVTNTSKFAIKRHVPNAIERIFGRLVNSYYEANVPPTVPVGLASIGSINISDGWLFVVGNTTGQRGVVAMDLRSTALFDYSYVITPVLQVEAGSILKYIATIEAYFGKCDTMNFFIKNSTNPTDPAFSTNTGWTAIVAGADNAPQALGPYFRIKVSFNSADDGNGMPAQLSEILVNYQAPNEISDYWSGDVDNTSPNGVTPTRTAAKLAKQYESGTVPRLYFRAYDAAGNLVILADTTTNAADFEYSTNGGSSWTALGTIPNTVGTRVRYKWSSPPGVDVDASWREA